MEYLSTEFLSALATIVVIDLVLAGDNAIVIALAARSLPVHLRQRAIIWGAAGAIVVRSMMTLIVVWLLKIPGLLFAGGALLVWIAYRLLAPEENEGESHAPAATTFWGAMKTIVIADAVMGLDNVLAVAGAARGSYVLVVLGLLISIPIVIWGSTLILKLVDRYPAIVYLGAGVLAWTATKMMISEPLLKDAVAAANGTAIALFYVAITGGVLWAGFSRNHRRLQSRISARVVAFNTSKRSDDPAIATFSNPGESAMKRILIPVDGSPNSQFAVRRLVNEFKTDSAMEIHLLNVQPWFSRHIARFVSAKDIKAFHHDRAEEALAPTRRLLEEHGIPHTAHHKTGERAQVIADEALRLGCHHILMSTARKNSLTRMLEDSTTNKVLELTSVPIEVIPGDAASRLERWGVPTAVIGVVIALVIAATD